MSWLTVENLLAALVVIELLRLINEVNFNWKNS